MNPSDKIYKIVSKIPKGKVLTYKQVAVLSGVKNPRLVGFYLHRNPNPDKIPCHRVVRSDGQLASGYAFGGPKKQKELLEKESVILLSLRPKPHRKKNHQTADLMSAAKQN